MTEPDNLKYLLRFTPHPKQRMFFTDEATPMTEHSYEELCRAQTEQRLSILKLTTFDRRFLKSLKIAV